MKSAYHKSIDLALSHGCQSIAFPAISCGVYGYPPKEAARIAVTVCTRPEYEQLTICFYLFSEYMATIWTTVLENHSAA